MSVPSPSVFRLYGNIVAANGTLTGLTALPIEYSANAITSGTLANARLPNPITANVAATSISSGTIANERLPADIYVSNVTAAAHFFGNGAFLTSLDASELTTGRIANARLPAQISIGTADPSGGFQLQLSSDSAAKPSTSTWTVSSDRRLKTDVEPADEVRCVEIVRQLPLQRYAWTSEYVARTGTTDERMLGWVAQDVEPVFPKAVRVGVGHGLDDCRALDVDQLYKVAYGALRRVIALEEALEARVAALEQQQHRSESGG